MRYHQAFQVDYGTTWYRQCGTPTISPVVACSEQVDTVWYLVIHGCGSSS